MAVSGEKYLSGTDRLARREPELEAVKQDGPEGTAGLRSINQQGFYLTQVTLFVKGYLKGRLR